MTEMERMSYEHIIAQLRNENRELRETIRKMVKYREKNEET